ncbi:MAG: hypothetical protein V3V08_08075 [Nannocystaceae bacterium]
MNASYLASVATWLYCADAPAPAASVATASPPDTPSRWSVQGSALSEATALPSHRLVRRPLHPGIDLGAEYSLTRPRPFQVALGISVGFFRHDQFRDGYWLQPNLRFGYTLPYGLEFAGMVGTGLFLAVSSLDTYREDSGGYVDAAPRIHPELLASLGAELGYDFGLTTRSPVTVFVRYTFSVETPFATSVGVPVLPLTTFHLGARFDLRRRKADRWPCLAAAWPYSSRVSRARLC